MTASPTRAPPVALHRRGTTLPELLVALALGGVVLGAFTLVLVHQERMARDLASRVRARERLREGLAPLTVELRDLSPAAGDLAAVAGRDSAIEFRTTIASGVACGAGGGTIDLALASAVTSPAADDTVWAFIATDSIRAWQPIAIAAVRTMSVTGGGCAFPWRAAALFEPAPPRASRWVLDLTDPVAPPVGTPLRITRAVRYSVYRAPDGRWYLGRREWSRALGRFETIQPVSGPYAPYAHPAVASSGFEWRHLQGEGTSLRDASAVDRVTAIGIAARSPSATHRNVIAVTVALRNGP